MNSEPLSMLIARTGKGIRSASRSRTSAAAWAVAVVHVGERPVERTGEEVLEDVLGDLLGGVAESVGLGEAIPPLRGEVGPPPGEALAESPIRGEPVKAARGHHGPILL